MTRLSVVAEGSTEVDFVTRVLKPHLEERFPNAILVNAPNLRGYRTYAAMKKFLRTLFSDRDPRLRVTTMIDLFKLVGDFPSQADLTDEPALQRVRRLEQRFSEDVGDSRFIPYLQLHEFEALVLVNPRLLAKRHPKHTRSVNDLAVRLQKFETPEHVNRTRPPSYWIRDCVPEYHKILDGVAVVSEIGLTDLRQRCGHFDQWLDRLEDLLT